MVIAYIINIGDQYILHITLHFLIPLALALALYRKTWQKSYALMMFGLAIDLDHLLASPIYDSARCSIGFHPLHSGWAIALYALLLFHRKTRIIGMGLYIHIVLDSIDCQITNGVWYTILALSSDIN